LKQLPAGQLLTLADDRREPPIGELDVVGLAGLPFEPESHRRSRDPRMRTAHRRQTERLVVARVFLVADANGCLLEQLHDGGKHLLPAQAWRCAIGGGACPQCRQRGSELDHAPVLRLVAHSTPARMVTVLLASARIAAGGLQVSERVRTDPDVAPGRRDRERFDAVQLALVAQRRAGCGDVAEAFACALTSDPWCGVGDVAKTSRCCARLILVARRRAAPAWRDDRYDPCRSSASAHARLLVQLSRRGAG
jgi:hypothetical protein